jgi:hypothetical protein
MDVCPTGCRLNRLGEVGGRVGQENLVGRSGSRNKLQYFLRTPVMTLIGGGGG